jgi:hypothetical protein
VYWTDPTGLCPDCPDAADYNEGDIVNPNGGMEFILSGGKWYGLGGELAEVTVSASRIENNPNYGDTEVGFLGSVAAASAFDQYNGYQWKGANGRYYHTGVAPGNSYPFLGNKQAGSVNTAKSKAKVTGRLGVYFGLYSVFATDLEYRANMNQGYGPNMTSHLQHRYKWDQSANVLGFFSYWGAAASFGYNAGHILESMCNCNIQYNPITKDFTPIEQTLMMYDRLGIDLATQKK